MAEILRCRQIIASPFTNRSFQLRPKVAARKCNLVILNRPNREKLSQPRRINVGSLAEATQQNLLATLKAKEVAGATSSQAPTKLPVNGYTSCVVPYFTHTSKHWTYILITVQSAPHWGRYALMNSLCLQTGMKMTKKKKEKTGMKEKIKNIVEGKWSKPAPDSYWLLPLLLSLPNPPSNSSASSPEKEEHKCNTLMTLLGHES